MQRVIKAAALKPDCKPSDQAQLARAYVELEKLKRITRGLPANTSQSIRADTPKKTRRQSQQVTAPIESEQDEKPTDQQPDQAPDEGKK